MQLIRKNYPVTIAWFAYIFLAWLLKLLFTVGMVWLRQKFFPEPSLNVSAVMVAVVFFPAEYLGFFVSVRWVAAPLSTLAKSIASKPKPSMLIIDWLSFGYYFVLLCFPLFLINAFPGFTVSGILYLIPIPQEMANIIGFVWVFSVSFFVYHKVVNSYFKEESESSTANEIQATVS